MHPLSNIIKTVNRFQIGVLLLLTWICTTKAVAQKQTYFAFGTNTLYDVVMIPNLEAEVAFGSHWSVLAESSFSSWSSKADKRNIQLFNGGLEGRYWLAVQDQVPLSGHFIGAFANLGAYDLENKGEGYQCKNAWMAGITYGYSFRLSESFRLQCSLGIGFLRGNDYNHYDEYEVKGKDYLVTRERGNFNWVGPTKAKISLVWIPQLCKGKKGDRQ